MAKSHTWPCREVPCLALVPNFRDVLALTTDCKRVAVDIPIGLPSENQKRLCDREAKAHLSKLEHIPSAVFFTPPRECLQAETAEQFQILHRKLCGAGAGYPVWGFLAKLREANERMTSELQKRIIEFHPELTWLRMGKRNLESKHTAEGIAERKKILRKMVPDLERILRWKDFVGRATAMDDLLDALVGIGVAKASLRGSRYRLPSNTKETDKTGLRMEIWY